MPTFRLSSVINHKWYRIFTQRPIYRLLVWEDFCFVSIWYITKKIWSRYSPFNWKVKNNVYFLTKGIMFHLDLMNESVFFVWLLMFFSHLDLMTYSGLKKLTHKSLFRMYKETTVDWVIVCVCVCVCVCVWRLGQGGDKLKSLPNFGKILISFANYNDKSTQKRIELFGMRSKASKS